MKTASSIQLLRIEEVTPTEKVLEEALGKDIFDVYLMLMQIIESGFQLEIQWRFYKDGKAWLCKVIDKKKTIFWLSIWDRFIKISVYFTEKTRWGIYDLQINNQIKDKFKKVEAIGKLIPLILDIEKEEELADLAEIIKYKKNLK